MPVLNCKGRLLSLEMPCVMGILNATPDSFHAASRATGPAELVARGGEMLASGATILDIGGLSTRPGAAEIPESEERDRVLPGIEALHKAFPEAILSVDTYRAGVAEAALAAGASVINDVSGPRADPRMLEVAARANAPYVAMHSRGTAATMQTMTHYEDVVTEVIDWLARRKETCRAAGVHDVICDPGFGFAKTPAQNFRLLASLGLFRVLDAPLLVGLSRKSTVYRTLGIGPEEALNGSTVLHTIALWGGAAIVRTHDVRATVEAVRLVTATRTPNTK